MFAEPVFAAGPHESLLGAPVRPWRHLKQSEGERVKRRGPSDKLGSMSKDNPTCRERSGRSERPQTRFNGDWHDLHMVQNQEPSTVIPELEATLENTVWDITSRGLSVRLRLVLPD
jgi:hypothetical protein